MWSYALRNERNRRKTRKEIPLMIAFTKEILPILPIRSDIHVINRQNKWLASVDEYAYVLVCISKWNKKKRKTKKSHLVCMCMYVCLRWLILEIYSRCVVKLGAVFIGTSHEALRTWILTYSIEEKIRRTTTETNISSQVSSSLLVRLSS